jgi:Leucine-rich repeat (LRR) protein
MKTTLLLLVLIALSFNSYCQFTAVPDYEFEEYLETHSTGYYYDPAGNNSTVSLGDPNSMGNGVMDGKVPTEKIDTVTYLRPDGGANTIHNLVGIEDFVALEGLWCWYEGIVYLNLSNNIALKHITLTHNDISTLILGNNSSLTYLGCGQNNLYSLDVSNHPALTVLYCDDNNLSMLDVSNNPALTELSCYGNQLTCLNLKNGNNTNMNCLRVHPETGGSGSWTNQITCAQVDDVSYCMANWDPNPTQGNCFSGFDGYIPLSTDCSGAGLWPGCSLGIDDLTTTTSKKLLKIVDLLGRETTFKRNTLLIYLYDDGSSEKVFKIE